VELVKAGKQHLCPRRRLSRVSIGHATAEGVSRLQREAQWFRRRDRIALNLDDLGRKTRVVDSQKGLEPWIDTVQAEPPVGIQNHRAEPTGLVVGALRAARTNAGASVT
jgi:hypothetical protein